MAPEHRLTAIADHLNHSTAGHPEETGDLPSVAVVQHVPEIRTVFPPLELEEHPIDEGRSLKVIVVGAGISGITSAILLPAKVPNIDLVIYERNDDIGGVWHTNFYPGVRCDVPAHAYQATFEPSTKWSTAYAAGDEIKAYWKDIVKRHELEKYIQLNTRVKRAEWSEEIAKWLVVVEKPHGLVTEEADFLVTATGHFSDPKLPKYDGIDDFRGLLRHSSNWDKTFDPQGKRIAIIGNGASGLQVLPPLQKVAKSIDHYARNKTWVAAPIGGKHLQQFVSEHIDKARTSPEEYLKFRKNLEKELFSRFGGIFKGAEKNNIARETITKLMAARLGDRTDILAEIIPEFSPNCRRLTPGPGYLEALAAENVRYITTGIEKFTSTGIQTKDGVHREVDAVICCTGHDVSFSTAFPIVAHGIDLQAAWRPGGSPGFPDSYLSIAAPKFPNFLMLLGPNSTGPAGTLTHSVENQITYCARVLRKASIQGIRSMAPSSAATKDFRAYCESFFPRTVMSEYCSSWYNGGIKGGRVHGVWPGSGAHVNAVRREPRWEDWEYTYLNRQGNRFAWLGNGWSKRDVQAASPGDATDNLDLTPWLLPKSLQGNVDLRNYHEEWWSYQRKCVESSNVLKRRNPHVSIVSLSCDMRRRTRRHRNSQANIWP